MDVLCQISGEIIALKNFQLTLMTLMVLVGIVGGYIYVGPIRSVINKLIALISSVLGLIGAGVIGFLLLYHKLIC